MIRKLANDANSGIIEVFVAYENEYPGNSDVDLAKLTEVLCHHLHTREVSTKVAALQWLFQLITISHEKVVM